MGLYKRKDSRFWWMAYTVKGGQRCESTKTPSKDLAKRILKTREAEIVLGRFQVGWPGERMTFAQLNEEFLQSHSSTPFSEQPGKPSDLQQASSRLLWRPYVDGY